MTNAEYTKLYLKTRSLNGKISLQTIKILDKAFKEAADLAAAQVLKTEAAGLSSLTSESWKQIERQLRAGADLISRASEKEIPLSVTKAYKNYLKIDDKYIIDAAKEAGQTAITKGGIQNMGIAVNFNLLQDQATRLYSDGYTFSERIWNLFDKKTGLPTGINGDYQYRIKNLILTGNAQGRDNIDIAKDIQVYVAKGKDAVFKEGRYGKLIPGTGEYKKRISGAVDWRALRLVRSEMNASIQNAGILQGELNPAALDSYNWIKNAGNPIDIDGSNNASGLRCIDLEEANPYKKDDVPSYQHANCSCIVEPNLMNQEEFVNDLEEWEPGEGGNSYLDKWYETQYLPNQ